MSSESSLARKNLMVDAGQIRALKKVLGAPTESEAVRIAVRDRLLLEETQAAFDRIRARGGIDDVFRRTEPAHARKRSVR